MSSFRLIWSFCWNSRSNLNGLTTGEHLIFLDTKYLYTYASRLTCSWRYKVSLLPRLFSHSFAQIIYTSISINTSTFIYLYIYLYLYISFRLEFYNLKKSDASNALSSIEIGNHVITKKQKNNNNKNVEGVQKKPYCFLGKIGWYFPKLFLN